MTYYTLSAKTSWIATLKDPVVRGQKVTLKMNKKQFLEIEDYLEIQFMNHILADGYGEEYVKEKAEEVDALRWRMYSSPREGNFVVVSEQIKNILSTYKLPPHKWYPIQFNNTDLELKQFHALHIIEQQNDITDYLGSEYRTVTIDREYYFENGRRRSRTSKEEIGRLDIRNATDFVEYMKNYRANKRLNLEISKRVIVKDYDVIPHIPNVLIINEKIKNELEQHNFTALSITEIKTPQYVVKSEII